MSTHGPTAPTAKAAVTVDKIDLNVRSDRGDTVETLLHDLNQPLTALTNFLAAAQIAVEQHATCITVVDLIDAADAEAGRARAIVRRLRDHLAH